VPKPKPIVIYLCGPTACGKTYFARTYPPHNLTNNRIGFVGNLPWFDGYRG